MAQPSNSITGRRDFLSKMTLAAMGGGAALAALAPSQASAANRFRTVVIDAGHGGHDAGALKGKVFEKHLNLDTARRLQRELKRRGYKTVMTRDDDTFIPLLTRARIGNKYRDSIFVSIHYNSTWKTAVTGLETYYYSYAGYKVASKVHTRTVQKLKGVNRGVKRARFSVLRNTKYPSILVEGGFISNTTERNKLVQAWYRQAIAESVAQGLDDYKRS
ncbi:MAG: N-acetylmuramoyl-L-alanine amidase [Verrucomicrobiales bacterium]